MVFSGLLPRPDGVGKPLLDPIDNALCLCASQLHACVIDHLPDLSQATDQLVDIRVELLLDFGVIGFHKGAVIDGNVDKDDAGLEFGKVCIGPNRKVIFCQAVDNAWYGYEPVRVVATESWIAKQKHHGESSSQLVCRCFTYWKAGKSVHSHRLSPGDGM